MRYEEHIAAEAHLRILEATKEAEEKKTIELIKNFLLVNTPIEFIIKATGWSESQILQLKTQ